MARGRIEDVTYDDSSSESDTQIKANPTRATEKQNLKGRRNLSQRNIPQTTN